jgi:hypothetical protein
MLKEGQAIRQGELLSYTIASGDMRYIEINKRDVYLRGDPQLGLIIRGEVPECGLDCDVNLSHILLEHAMTCSGCKEPEMALDIADQFGRRLGQTLAIWLCQDAPEAPNCDQLCDSFEVILKSMDAQYHRECDDAALVYDLEECPILDSARSNGFSQWTPMARHSFVSLCESVISTLQPTWDLQRPNGVDADGPIRKIAIAKK